MALSRDFIDGEPTWTDEDRATVRIIGRVALMAFGIGVLCGAIFGGLLLVYAIGR